MGGSYRLRKSRNAKFRASFVKRSTGGLVSKVRPRQGKSFSKPGNNPYSRPRNWVSLAPSRKDWAYDHLINTPSDQLAVKRQRTVDKVRSNWANANKVVQAFGAPLKNYQIYSAANSDSRGHSPFHNWVVGQRRR